MHHETMNGIVILIALGAGSLWIAWRLKIPSILVLLAVGFVARPATGLFRPDEVLGALTFPFVSLAAAVVLFEGGLTASWEEMRGVATIALPADEVASLDELRERFGKEPVPLFAVDDERRVSFVHAEQPWPTSGTLVVLAPP